MRLLPIVLAGALLFSQGCRSWQSVSPAREPPTTGSITSTRPPFVTKEPERYQAVRIITTIESFANPRTSAPLETRTVRVFIARDGEKRREEYDGGRGKQIVYLENAQGRFVLLPSNKSYADLIATDATTESVDSPDEAPELSADRLLHESRSEARYQKLGIESLEGRTTTKYRVTKAEAANGTAATGETLIWIDESLGMPVRSETTFSGDHYTKVLMELRDISLKLDPTLFEVPADYKKVTARLIPKEDGQQKIHKKQ